MREDLADGWQRVQQTVKQRFRKTPDLKTILFLIGLRELGTVPKEVSKEEKQDLMNLATCKIFSLSGYFEASELDPDGWPIWVQKEPMPKLSVEEQESFLIEHVILYFEREKLW